MLNNTQKIKDFFNLNGYFLRLNLTSQQLSLISYNSELLDGIKYQAIFTLEEIKKNEKIKNLTVIDLYELISNKIKGKKFMIKNDQNNVILYLLDSTENNPSKDLQIRLISNNKEYISEYENVLSNIIINLKEENKSLRNEINEIKKFINIRNINNKSCQSFAEVKILKINQKNSNDYNKANLSQSQNLLKKPLLHQIENSLNNSKNHNLPSPIKKITSGPTHEPKGNLAQNQIVINQVQLNAIDSNNKNNLKIIDNLDLYSLANIKYQDYPQVEVSSNSFGKIVAYGVNSYHGIFKKNNEDRTKVILDSKLTKTINNSKGKPIIPNISYFAIYDGHGGNKCSDFLQEKLHTLLFNSTKFPIYTLQAIYDSFIQSEQEFNSISFDSQNLSMLDKSGSCALSALFINEWCFISNLGDSRALYSLDSGKNLLQITRDHKPNDLIERTRIEKAGGRIYKDTRLKINGQKIVVNEQALPGFVFPYRVVPGNLSVSLNFFV